MKVQSEENLVDLLVECSTEKQRQEKAGKTNFIDKIITISLPFHFHPKTTLLLYTVLLAFQGDKEESLQYKKVVI